METMTSNTLVKTFEVVRGDSEQARNSGALSSDYVVRVLVYGTFAKFLTRKQSTSIRYFISASSARKAITREKRGDYHR
jgi:hypothetical protein